MVGMMDGLERNLKWILYCLEKNLNLIKVIQIILQQMDLLLLIKMRYFTQIQEKNNL